MKSLPAIVCIVLSLSFHAAIASAQSGNDKVQVNAVADVSTVEPDKSFWIGFKFTIEPGWHIYWKNPGDSGLATQVKLKLPDGFTAGELQFPIPTRLVQPGDVVNYGYENQVTLLVQITPKKDLPRTGSVKISAKTTWLVCKDDCMPGGSPVSLELPIADKSTAANQEDFKEWTARLPVKQDPADISAMSVANQLADGNGHAGIEITWKNHPTDIQFIPGVMATGEISNVKQATDPATSVFRLTFEIKNKKDPAPITGLMTFTKTDGTRAALEISFPPEPSEKK